MTRKTNKYTETTKLIYNSRSRVDADHCGLAVGQRCSSCAAVSFGRRHVVVAVVMVNGALVFYYRAAVGRRRNPRPPPP